MEFFTEIFTAENLIALVALTAMEVVLGIDNIVMIVVVTGSLPKDQQPLARRVGLGLAMAMRIVLLMMITWIVHLTDPVFELTSLGIAQHWLEEHHHINEISIRDLILLAGGLFLIYKSVTHIHENIEGHNPEHDERKAASFAAALVQIAVFDLVFSLDSVITAVGMAESIAVMAIAVILAVVLMLIFSEAVSAYVDKHPTVKMLALSFMLLIGVMLVAEGVGTEINKGYIYSAMAWALIVEFLNQRVRGRGSKRPFTPRDVHP